MTLIAGIGRTPRLQGGDGDPCWFLACLFLGEACFLHLLMGSSHQESLNTQTSGSAGPQAGIPSTPPPMTLALSQLATSHLQEGLAKAGQDDRRTPWKNWPIPRWI